MRVRLMAIVALALAGRCVSLPAAELQRLGDHVPAAVRHLTPSGRLPATNRLSVAIALPLRDPQGLSNFLRDVYDPASPNYHHYLSSAEFTARFGPTVADYEAVAAFTERNGLRVSARHANRALLDVEGPVSALETALHVTMNVYRHPDGTRDFYAADGAPSLDLGVPVLAVSGLDNFNLPRPRLQERSLTNSANVAPNGGSGPGGGYRGQDFRHAYAPDSLLTGSGQTVGLLQFDGYTASDITYYENAAGLPNVPLQNVLLDGFSGSPTGFGEIEVSLDIEMVVSMAPGVSKIVVYEAGPYGDWHDILNRMASDNLASQLSCSWYSPGGMADPIADQIWQQMAAQGQSFFNASGDYNAYNGLIDFPGDSPFITQVGGTTLSMTGTGAAYGSEVVWNRGNGIGSGGGISTQYAIPSWQAPVNMTANFGSLTQRNTPDVALTAESVYVRADGSDHVVGGTSCAAPLWAGFAALINQQAAFYGQPALGFFNPTVYSLGLGSKYATSFHDITVGNNGTATHFPAVAGYDLATGWGSPRGQALIDAIIPPDPLILSPAAGFVSTGAVGGPFSISVENIALINASSSNLNWAVSNNAAWLTVSPGNGLLASGSVTNLSVSLNAVASNLPPGVYTGQVLVSNLTSGFVHPLAFSLTVHDPLVITPGTGFAAVGPVGGPFLPWQQTYVLTNSGLSSLNWTLSNSANWLDATGSGGQLTAGAATNMVVALNTVASNLPPALYNGDVLFSNITGGFSQDITFSLRTGELPLNNNGFELGSFAGWTLSGNTIGMSITSNAPDVHSGLYAAKLSPQGSLGHLSQTLTTVPGHIYLISCWLQNRGLGVGNEFQVNWAGSTVYDQMNLGSLTWTNLQMAVAAVSSNTVLDFGFRNESFYFGFDDVQVFETTNIPAVPPVITSQPASQTLTAGWTAQFAAGVTGIPPFFYQWQFAGSNLAGATSPNLILSPVTLAEAGSYSLLVSNAFGSTNSSNATLTVTVPTCDPPPSGLVSWWAGEGNAGDSFGTNNGTLQGGTAYTPGVVNQAFSFDGTSGTVVVPDSPSLRLTDQITIEAWIRPLTTNGDRGIVSKVSASTGSFGYQFGLSGNALVGQFNSPGLNWPSSSILTPAPLQPGVWCHVAWTYDQSIMRLYFNGQLIAASAIGPHAIATSASELRISGADSHVYFNGQIDEPGIYNRALSGAEIVAIYNAGSAGKCASGPIISGQPASQTVPAGSTATFGVTAGGTQPLGYQWLVNSNPISPLTNPTAATAVLLLTNVQMNQSGGSYSVIVTNAQGAATSSNALLTVITTTCDPAPLGLVSWWAGEGDAVDTYGSNNGTLQGGASFSSGESGQAFNFDGSSGTVSVPDSTSLEITNQITIETWINPRTLSGDQALVTKASAGTGNNGYQFGLTSGNQLVGQFNSPGLGWPSSFIIAPIPITTGVWSHVAWTYDQSVMRLYYNGQLVSSQNTGPHPIATSSSALRISGADNHVFFNGLMDEVSLYNRALSSNEILAIYNAGSDGKCIALPVITSQPSNQVVQLGATASFSVQASGPPPLTYQWYLNSSPISAFSNSTATNVTLVLTNVQLSQTGGLYSVSVGNRAGITNSSNATLTVYVPPCDPPPPGLISWWSAETNALDSSSTNNGTLQGGVTFTTGEVGHAFNFDGASGTVVVPDSASLQLTSQITIEAWINVAVTNGDRGIVSKVSSATGLNGYQFGLSGNQLLGLFNSPGQSWGSSAIVCPIPIIPGTWNHVAWTYDQSTMKLFFNGQLISTNFIGAHPIATSTSRLHISSTDDNNVYFNGQIDEASIYNTALTDSQILAIYNAGVSGKCPTPVRPVITAQPTNSSVVQGSTASFTVGVSGTPPLAYQWSFNSGAISPALNPSATNATLIITNSQGTNGGLYSVLVTNAAGGTNSSNALLTILFPPHFIINPSNDLAGLGCTVSFNALATGTGSLAYQWQKDGSNITGQTGTNLTILHAQPSDFGGYALVASNAYGQATSSVAMLSLDHPPTPGNIIAQRYPSGAITLATSILLANATDQDTDTVSLVSVNTSSIAGGTVGVTNGVITYLPPLNYTNADAFNYTLTDGHCSGISVGTVLVQIRTDINPASQITIVKMPDGSVHVNFTGIPGYAYRVQASDSLTLPDWHDVATLTADPFGNYVYADAPSTNGPARYYRSVWP